MAAAAIDPEELKKELKKSNISDFFMSNTLSDIVVVNPMTGAQYK